MRDVHNKVIPDWHNMVQRIHFSEVVRKHLDAETPSDSQVSLLTSSILLDEISQVL